VACVVAIYATRLGPLIDVVNQFGSFFYGRCWACSCSPLASDAPRPRAFWGLLAGMAAVATVASTTDISFLWHNVVGASVVVAVGVGISAMDRRRAARA